MWLNFIEALNQRYAIAIKAPTRVVLKIPAKNKRFLLRIKYLLFFLHNKYKLANFAAYKNNAVLLTAFILLNI